MAIVTRKASDISGQEGSDEQFAVVVVRQHPHVSESKALDVLVDELGSFKSINDLVMLEIQMPDGTKKEVAMRLSDLNKVAPNMDDIIKNARGTRGRLPGTRLANGA